MPGPIGHAPIYAAGSAASPVGFDPNDFSPMAWFDANDLALSDGGAVASWPDRSGNSRDAAVVGTGPTFRSSLFNGKPSVDFAPGNGYLLAASVPSTPVPFTVAVAVYGDTAGTNARIMDTGGAIMRMNLSPGGNIGQVRDFAGADLTDTEPCPGYYFIAMTCNGTVTNNSETWFNGASKASTANANALSRIAISSSSATTPWDGLIAELIVFDQLLGSSDLAACGQYLSDKWS